MFLATKKKTKQNKIHLTNKHLTNSNPILVQIIIKKINSTKQKTKIKAKNMKTKIKAKIKAKITRIFYIIITN